MIIMIVIIQILGGLVVGLGPYEDAPYCFHHFVIVFLFVIFLFISIGFISSCFFFLFLFIFIILLSLLSLVIFLVCMCSVVSNLGSTPAKRVLGPIGSRPCLFPAGSSRKCLDYAVLKCMFPWTSRYPLGQVPSMAVSRYICRVSLF